MKQRELDEYLDHTLIPGQVVRHRRCPFCEHDIKDKGFIVKRTSKGWVLYCHRCQQVQMVRRDNIPLGEVRRLLLRRNMPAIDSTVVYSQVSLPYDFTAEISSTGMLWLNSNGVTPEEVKTHGFGYSPRLDRVILPVRSADGELVYWQGRRLTTDKTQPKYLNVKSRSRSDIFFRVEKDSPVIVIVEDILSALAVARAGISSLALLGSHVNDDLLKALPKKRIKFWLDPDKRKESVKFSKKLRAHGFTCSSILVPDKDPKEYGTEEIKEIVLGKGKIT